MKKVAINEKKLKWESLLMCKNQKYTIVQKLIMIQNGMVHAYCKLA